MIYIVPALVLGGCGVLAGVLLTVAAKIFHVETDERVEKICGILPQANCGACGFAGCADYADAIVNKGAASNLCRPGGSECSAKIAEILGTSAAEVVPMTAVVRCNGDCSATSTQFEFGGVQLCKAVKRFYEGNGLCRYGCIGLGDCAKVCDRNAISVIGGVAKVSPVLCRACGKCVSECPNNLIVVKPLASRTEVLCSSSASGKSTKVSCKNGCIGCKICEKKCPHAAIKVENFHALIDYEKCTNCGECIKACPVKVIHSCEG